MQENRQFHLTVWIVAVLGLAYFICFLLPNSRGASDIPHFVSGDEAVTYPYVVHMLEPSQDIHELWWRLIIYGDYHYGYPFYLASFLSLLPLRLASGNLFFDRVQLNLLILRQMISVLPMILAAMVLVYLQTRFRKPLAAAGLLLFLFSIPGVVRQNIQWWHPDALAVLAVVLTIFFLDRDRLRFGRNFWLAAVFCGLATAIKLQGVFFFLTIPGYVLAGLIKKVVRWKGAALAALGFVLLMSVTIVASNPFLFYASQREKLVRVQAEKQQEITFGYAHDDPAAYQKGPQFWVWTLDNRYGPVPLLLLLAAGLAAGCLWGSRRGLSLLILSWSIPLSLYLFYFVAPKPDHYWLPVMLPLFSTAAGGLELLHHAWQGSRNRWLKLAALAALVIAAAAMVYLTASNLTVDIQLWLEGMKAG
jgi:4-amino-4-deoxy-L-arabinose transferase-like glycosyltransferase